jgi:RNA polymerase sigma-70 factor, ECF subfamily
MPEVPRPPGQLTEQLTAMRREIVGYAYRMLGSPFEAEDAAQETLLRAWRHAGDFDPSRATLRTWVYRIATNVCVDLLRAAGRRGRSTDYPSSAGAAADLGTPLPESAFVLPILDSALDPAELAERRETVRLAFVAALQHLPPRQRAVLILRDVLCWPATEVATLLDTTVASVTSALQRARQTLRTADPGHPPPLPDAGQRALVERYADAFHRDDIAALVALLHHDAVTSMPPFTWWIRGATTIGAVMSASDGACHGARLEIVHANGGLACWQHRPTGAGGAFEPFALLLFDFDDQLITEITTFLLFGTRWSPSTPPDPPPAPAPP